MSNVNVVHGEPEVEIELTDFEKHSLVQAYKILKNIDWELFTEEAEDTEVYISVSSAKGSLKEFLMDYLGIDPEVTHD